MTGSRLHFGLLCAGPSSRWHYGGIGLMIQQPGWQLNVEATANSDRIHASRETRQRIQRIIAEHRRCHPDLPAVKVTVQHEAPMHAGLGSGTQLTLAFSVALRILSGRPRPASADDIALMHGRSRRSAIGTFGFDYGGFVVDSGRSPVVRPKAVERLHFPDGWRIVLIIPGNSSGLSGTAEEAFFGSRAYLKDEQVSAFEELITDRVVPAIRAADYPAFRDALAEYGLRAGKDYATAQGGIYSSPAIRHAVDRLPADVTHGLVQSSWGPTVAMPAADDAHAAELAAAFQSALPQSEATITIVQPMNQGATIRTTASDSYRSFG